MTLFRLAIRNLWRKRFRNFSIILAVILATGLIFSTTVTFQSVGSSLALSMERLGADIMVVPSGHETEVRKILLAGKPTTFYMEGKNLANVRDVEGVENASPQLFMASSVLLCCTMPTVLLVGYDPSSDFTVTPWKRYVHRVSDKPLDEVMIGAQTLYASERPFMEFYGKKFKIGSSLHPTGIGFLDFSIFMTMSAARDMIEGSKHNPYHTLKVGPDRISSILVKVAKGHDVRAVAEDIEKSLPGVRAVATAETITSARRHVEGGLRGVIAIGIICWFMTVFLMGLVFSMATNERRREFGILRSMGAARGHIFRLIISEAVFLAGLGGLIGVGIGWLTIVKFNGVIMASLIKDLLILQPSPLYFASYGGICIVAVLISGAAAALYPAFISSRMDPYSAIRMG